MSQQFEPIDKEKIAGLSFPAEDVLSSEDKKKERIYELNRAMTLGNMEQIKFKIYFEDDNTPKYTETTIWGVTDKRVILKKGVVIPIHRIHKINY